jgi:G3E family GTPase
MVMLDLSTTSNPQITIPKRGMPVTIITGFLGSGKTTLLNHILSNRQDLKVAILVNEFGDIDIDSQLLVSIDENMVELTNGCICCTINDSLVDAVYSILERQEKVDYLVVETTGLADPLPLVLTFLGTGLRDLTHLDSIITMVDAEAFTEDCFFSDAAMNQIIYGDIILLNKTDLVSAEKIQWLETFIHQNKMGARILTCQQGQVPLPLILDVDSHQKKAHHQLLNLNKKLVPRFPHSEQNPRSEHLANDGYVSVAFESDRALAIEKFQHFLDELTPDVCRGKGILWFAESESKYIFQLSGKRCSLEVDHWSGPQRCSQAVFIGRQLESEPILQALAACYA